jgi:hypothetical protein
MLPERRAFVVGRRSDLPPTTGAVAVLAVYATGRTVNSESAMAFA